MSSDDTKKKDKREQIENIQAAKVQGDTDATIQEELDASVESFDGSKKDEERKDEKEKVQELEDKVYDLDNQLRRAVADYLNLQKRVEEERREVIKYGNRELLLSLLPALNTLFLAGKYTEDQGVQLTIKSVLEVLKNVGVEKIATEGQEFNADTMEVVEVIAGEDGKVVEEVRPGFILYGKLISPSLVKVGGKE